MPRVNVVKKAQKDQGQCKCGGEIKRGDGYRWWKFRYGGRRVRCMKPGCAPRPSDLTQSEFLGQLYDMEDALQAALDNFRNGMSDPEDCAGVLNDLAQQLRDLGSECQDKFDNMPEGLQQGDTGQLLENRAQECEGKADELESAASEVESLELYETIEKYLEANAIERNGGESDEDYQKRIQQEMDEENENARDQAASNAEVDLSID